MGNKNRKAVAQAAQQVQSTLDGVVGALAVFDQPLPASQVPAVEATPAPAPAPAKVILYTIAAPKRPLTGTHFGKSGNEATHKALCDAANANGGRLTWEQIMEVCKEQNHKSFATYALKRLKVISQVQAEV